MENNDTKDQVYDNNFSTDGIPQSQNQSESPDTINNEVNQFVSYDQNSNSGHKGTKILFIAIIFIFLFMFVGSAFAGYLVAYNKIKLPNKDIQNKISLFVQSLPFTPKTAEYIVAKSIQSHSELSSLYLKSSVAVESDGLESMFTGLGMNNFDATVEGAFEFNDPENPKLELSMFIPNLFNGDFILKDKIAYFNIKQIPAFIYTYVGLTSENIDQNPLLNRWAFWDTNPPDTSARQYLQQNKDQKEDQKFIQARLVAFAESKLLPLFKVSEEEVDGVATYKLSLEMDQSQLTELYKEIIRISTVQRLPENDPDQIETAYQNMQNELYKLKSGKVYLWIEKDTYYLKKGTLHYTVEVPKRGYIYYPPPYAGEDLGLPPQMEKQEIDFVITFDLSRFGENFDINVPQDAISVDDLMLELTTFMQQNSPYNEYGIYEYQDQYNYPQEYPTPTITQDLDQSIVFTGTITAVNQQCYVDGGCSIKVDDKWVGTQIGGLMPPNSKPLIQGQLIGIGVANEEDIGKRVEVYASKTEDGNYSIYGTNNNYYIKVLQ